MSALSAFELEEVDASQNHDGCSDVHSERSISILDQCIEVSAPSTPRPKMQTKLSDKMELAATQNYPCFSFEYFPPKNKQGLMNLTERIRRMGTIIRPQFVDITHSKQSKTLRLAQLLMDYTTVDIMVHLSLTNMTKKDLHEFLDECRDIGIRNILAIRGDPPRGYDSWIAVDDDLQHCADLVRFIRREYGDYFSVFVGGYPEGHHNSPSLAQDIEFLREKVDAGADGVITQLFYDTAVFLHFVAECRRAGITVPIVPGLMPMQTYGTFVRVVSFTNVTVPDAVWTELEPIKNDDEKVKEYGIEMMVRMCTAILDHGINTLHFYTFNLERAVTEITNRLNLHCERKLRTMHRSKSANALAAAASTKPPAANDDDGDGDKEPQRVFPWDSSKGGFLRRTQESVRPIFWANRSESYLHRTAHWDEFPNGRWGDSRSPAYGEFLEHHLFRNSSLTVRHRQKMWGGEGALRCIVDVCRVFQKYLDSDIAQLPWCSQNVANETTTMLLEPLKVLNGRGFLTINSQPQVNGAPSTDPVVGWGGSNGFVYQKAYLEFFCSPQSVERLLAIIDEGPFPTLSYQAINRDGRLKSNVDLENVNAVTWGVFRNQQIQQPTIVDPQSFIAWKDEAFSLWQSMWQSLYEKESASWSLLEDIQSNWFLVNIVENDYINGDIFAPFAQLLEHDKRGKQIRNVFKASLNRQHQKWCCSSWKRTLSPDESETRTLSRNYSEIHSPSLKAVGNPYLDETLLTEKPIEKKYSEITDGTD